MGKLCQLSPELWPLIDVILFSYIELIFRGGVSCLPAALLLAHLSRRLIGELIVYPWSGVRRRRPSYVVRRPQCSDIFFSETAWPIEAKFYVEPP